jgi:hypothetical protein
MHNTVAVKIEAKAESKSATMEGRTTGDAGPKAVDTSLDTFHIDATLGMPNLTQDKLATAEALADEVEYVEDLVGEFLDPYEEAMYEANADYHAAIVDALEEGYLLYDDWELEELRDLLDEDF